MEIKEIKQEINNTAKKEPQQNKEKAVTTFTPPNENRHNDSRSNPNIISRQNSAFKNLKNEIKSDSANIFPNCSPQKLNNGEYFNCCIISPFKDPFVETPFKHPTKYNMTSPENMRFNSSMNGKFIFFIVNIL